MTAVTTDANAAPAGVAAAVKAARGKLSRAQMVLGGFVGLLVAALATYGMAGSYETVKKLAQQHKVPLPEWVPIGIDGGLVGVVTMDLYFTWVRHPSRGLRIAARAFTVGSVVANALAARHEEVVNGVTVTVTDWTALILHIFAPLVLLVMVESVRAVLMQVMEDDGEPSGYEKLGWVCWATRPGPSFKTWKRMRVSRIRTYAAAEDFEARRRGAIARLRIEYGKGFLGWGGWRTKARQDIVWGLRTVTRVEVLDSLVAIVANLSGPGTGTPARPRNPQGTPLPAPNGNPAIGAGRTSGGNPSGTPSDEDSGTPGGGHGSANGNPRPEAGNPGGRSGNGNPSNGPTGNPSGNGTGNPSPGTPSTLSREEVFRQRMDGLRTAFPKGVPGVNRIKDTVGGGYGTAQKLQAALAAERGLELPSAESDGEVVDPLLAGSR